MGPNKYEYAIILFYNRPANCCSTANIIALCQEKYVYIICPVYNRFKDVDIKTNLLNKQGIFHIFTWFCSDDVRKTIIGFNLSKKKSHILHVFFVVLYFLRLTVFPYASTTSFGNVKIRYFIINEAHFFNIFLLRYIRLFFFSFSDHNFFNCDSTTHLINRNEEHIINTAQEK